MKPFVKIALWLLLTVAIIIFGYFQPWWEFWLFISFCAVLATVASFVYLGLTNLRMDNSQKGGVKLNLLIALSLIALATTWAVNWEIGLTATIWAMVLAIIILAAVALYSSLFDYHRSPIEGNKAGPTRI